MFRNLNMTVEAFADVSRPYLQESIEEAPAALSGDPRVPAPAALPARQRAALRELRPGARALRTAAAPLADAIDAGVGTLAALRRLQPAPRADFGTLEGPDAGPARRRRPRRPDDRSPSSRGPRSATSRRCRRCATTVTLFLRNASNLLSDGGTTARGSGSSHRPADRQEHERPPSAPGRRRRPGPTHNYLHANPLPNTASPPRRRADGASARPATSPTSRAARSATSRATRATRTERTTRDAGGGALMAILRRGRRRRRSRQGPHGPRHVQGRPDHGDRAGDPRLLRVRQGHPVHAGVPPQGGLRDVEQHPARARRCVSPA